MCVYGARGRQKLPSSPRLAQQRLNSHGRKTLLKHSHHTRTPRTQASPPPAQASPLDAAPWPPTAPTTCKGKQRPPSASLPLLLPSFLNPTPFPTPHKSFLQNLEMNEERYLTLLSKLIGEAENLQNNPQQGLVPQEKLAADHVVALLEPYSKEQGKGIALFCTAFLAHTSFPLEACLRFQQPLFCDE